MTEGSMTPYLIWEEERAEVRSVEELDAVLDRLTLQAKEDTPFTVELYITDATMLYIIVGRDESQVVYYASADKPVAVSSVGPWEDDEPINFLYRGYESSVPKRYFVPITEAREAMRRFFQTGAAPNNITWYSD
jgi:hypothetical protein